MLVREKGHVPQVAKMATNQPEDSKSSIISVRNGTWHADNGGFQSTCVKQPRYMQGTGLNSGRHLHLHCITQSYDQDEK